MIIIIMIIIMIIIIMIIIIYIYIYFELMSKTNEIIYMFSGFPVSMVIGFE
jgi:hypothetical protein